MARVEFANSLRGIAALLVMISHYVGVFWLGRPIVAEMTHLPQMPEAIATPAWAALLTGASPINFGALGVAIFFLISGFVIPLAFEGRTRSQFVVGRILRIWPTYLAGFAIGMVSIAVASALFGLPFPYNAQSVFVHAIAGLRGLLQSQNLDGVVWTLEVEILFYVIAAIIAPLLKRGAVLTYATPIAICAFALLFHDKAPLTYLPYLIFMFVGVALNFHYRQLQPLRTTIFWVIVLLILSASIRQLSPDFKMLAPNYLLAVIIFISCMAGSQLLPTDSIRLPGNRILAFFAAISFPLYVVHALFGYAFMTPLIQKAGFSAGVALSLALVATFVLAHILHVAVEMPSLQIGKSLANRMMDGKNVSRRALQEI